MGNAILELLLLSMTADEIPINLSYNYLFGKVTYIESNLF
jgi:hypothetical protein